MAPRFGLGAWLARASLSMLGLALPLTAVAAPRAPADFAIENAVPGAAFDTPTNLAFLPDGRLLVAEKRGVVKVIQSGVVLATPLWSAEREVLNNGDRGLIGIAVDPQYRTNHRVYFFYSVDPDSDLVDDEIQAFGRVTRYTTLAADSNVVDPASRMVLVGATWREGFTSPTLSHAVDDLAFGADGSLLITNGDGSHYELTDAGGYDAQQFGVGKSDPSEDIGAFRSQDLASLCGKVLRINPETGTGYASNPFVAGDLTANAAKVWALGLRNPFRLCVQPGTGSADTAAANPGVLLVGDVGLNEWEEVDVVDRGGMNLGWPCREGPDEQRSYAVATPAHHGCASVTDSLVSPTFYWNHDDSTRSAPYGLIGNCTAGGAFYTGANYPAHYRGRYFFGEFGGGWLRVATLDSLHNVTQMQDFASGLEGPVDWAADPVSGDLYYSSIYTGQVRRIRYVGGGGAQPPVARASASPAAGAVWTPIHFSSLGSYDPQGSDLTFAWSFGDELPGSNAAHPTHAYESPGLYSAILTVSTTLGAIARDTVQVVVVAQPGFPVTDTLDTFARADGPIGSPWTGTTTQVAIQDSALVLTGASTYATWNGRVFGTNQEVFFRFDAITAAAPEQNLLLKVQSTSWSSGAIQVVYDASHAIVSVNTYTPGTGWAKRGGPWRGVVFAAGDQFGARAYSNGIVEVYKNGAVLGSASAEGWAYATRGGRIGFQLRSAPTTRMVNFGGGDVSTQGNQPPTAIIASPADGAFFHAGETIVMRGSGSDAEDSSSALGYRWDVNLHHNNHVHPDIHVFSTAVDSFPAENHDDGTGISLELRLVVTDRGGRRDTATAALYPEIDLAPSDVATTPGAPTGAGPIRYAFTLVNRGRMPAPISRWRLVLDGATIAQGDTLVPALDSVLVQRTLESPPVGAHALRVVADTLGAVTETDEANNGRTRAWSSPPFPSTLVIDPFDGPNGPLRAPWVGQLTALRVRNLGLTAIGASANAIWNGAVFGPDQEAFFRFDSVAAAAPEQDLLLKVQGPNRADGAIQVVWAAHQSVVVVNTYSPTTGWARHGGPWRNLRFAPGDQLGARASSNGTVTVFKNGVAIGTCVIQGWEFAGAGGRVGIMLKDAQATHLVDFGGGDVTNAVNTPPSVTMLAPADSGFYVAGMPLALTASATDAEDSTAALRARWRVGAQIRASLADSVIVPPLAGGGGLPVPIRLVVTDRGGLADTAAVTVFPEVDLEPVALATDPPAATGIGVTRYAFTIANHGRMTSPPTRWMLVADGIAIAVGDTTVRGADSVVVTRALPSLPVGPHMLQVVVDTLHLARELDERNNVLMYPWVELGFPATPTLDAFARADGPPGAAWIGTPIGYAIADSALVQTGVGGYVTWGGSTFGADQEAWVRFDSVAVTGEHDLLLKVQGTSWMNGAIQVVYSGSQSLVVLNTYNPYVGWVRRGGPWRNLRFDRGDTLGARALADGRVEVFKNRVVVGEASVWAWPFAASGGRIGLILANAPRARIGRFGGGTVGSRPPVAPALAQREAAPPVAPSRATAAMSRSPVERFALSAPYPNPVMRDVSFALALPDDARVKMEAFDVLGRRVWAMREAVIPAGRSTLRWSGEREEGGQAATGLYVVRITVDGKAYTRRMIRVR